MSIPLRNTARSYGLVSQLFHWLVVALILFQYTWAWRIGNTEGLRARFELVTQHKTVGMAVLGLALLRLAWRAFNRPPPLPDTLPRWERTAARTMHWLLYALILAQPLSGWLYSSAAGLADYWWGPVRFPSLMESSEPMEDLLRRVHQTLALTLALLAGLHVLAALRHHFLLGDDVLRRMLPLWRRD
jgi:cytochrome b561